MSKPNFSVCVVIPVYKHAHLVSKVITKVLNQKVDCILVNDGCDNEQTKILRQLTSQEKRVHLVEQFPNQGKGQAVKLGFQEAMQQGYSHAVQVDADGQHNIDDLPALINQAKLNPSALVTGIPLYDASVPKSRLYSRYITHFWVWVETLSFEIKDSMCGFRVYPLASTLKLLNKQVASRMDFDTQIMVRMYWQGTQVISVPTRVIYPEDGVSNFRLFRDNVRISIMHTKLVFGMLIRLPILLYRKLNSPTKRKQAA